MSETRPEQAATVTPGQAAYGETQEHMKRWADGKEDHRGEDSDERTPGQAAYEAFYASYAGDFMAWEDNISAWEAAAQAADREITAYYEDVVSGLHRERDRLTERVAELVTEGNELRRERDRLADELQKAEATIADYRDALCAMQAERDKLQHAPAVVTAGTEHPTEQIRDLAIRDKEGQP